MKKLLAHILMNIALILDRWAWRLLYEKPYGEPVEYKYKVTALNSKGEVINVNDVED